MRLDRNLHGLWMMTANDIVICSENREQENLVRWRYAVERRRMKVGCKKTEYMCVNERDPTGTMRLQGAEIKKKEDFNLG